MGQCIVSRTKPAFLCSQVHEIPSERNQFVPQHAVELFEKRLVIGMTWWLGLAEEVPWGAPHRDQLTYIIKVEALF